MPKSFRYVCLAFILSASIGLSACGQKGDLYLPEGESAETGVGS